MSEEGDRNVNYNWRLTQTEQLERVSASHDRLLAAAKDLLDTIPAPPTDDGRRVFEALRQAIWDAAP
jgi:hypothetical protein